MCEDSKSEAAAERRRRGNSSRSVKSVTSESERIAELERELAGYRKGKKKEVGKVGVKFPVCEYCGELGHKAENCPEYYDDDEEDDTEEVNYAYGDSKGQGFNSNTYHLGLRNHPNFRYGNASSQLNRTFRDRSGYQQGSSNQNRGYNRDGNRGENFSGNQDQQKRSSGNLDESVHSKLDALLKAMTDQKAETKQQFELRDKSSEAMMKQIGQLASDMAKLQKNAGQLPSNTIVNPNHHSSSSKKHVNEVSILRNGKKYDNKVGGPPPLVDGVVEEIDENLVSDDEPEPIELNKPNKSETKNNKSVPKDDTNNSKDKERMKTIPYPDALLAPSKAKMASKRGPQQEEMWETFKQVKINIPLLDAIKKIPAYAKYLKELCTQKRSHKIPKHIDFTDNVSAILSGALPPKLQDPGTPIIPIQVGDFKMTRALLDLGASISILPGSLYDQYDFGPLRAAATTVVLADQTPKLPRGILTDVIVKVEDFYFPVDFLVLDYVSGERTKQPTVILGRPFLATANANINCRNGTVDMAFGNRKLRINVFTRGDNSPVDEECFMADFIDECIPLYDSVVSSDGAAETCFLFDRLQVETDKLLEDEERQMEMQLVAGFWDAYCHWNLFWCNSKDTADAPAPARRKRQRTDPRVIRYDSDVVQIVPCIEPADIMGY
ncbi:uncharacterized protein LOC143613396 [Bidens hawaiensis]|uniref:uncharacterized protein LOC143613396 n=1 Tax=Bidens hawaiensis TaxID=980011 RepID=UPI004049C771